jgi:hypothetical protein
MGQSPMGPISHGAKVTWVKVPSGKSSMVPRGPYDAIGDPRRP